MLNQFNRIRSICFSFQGEEKVQNSSVLRKINHSVKFSEIVDFSEHSLEEDDEDYIHRLYAIIVHRGEVGSGHYFAYVRNSRGQWFCTNDSDVRKVDVSDVLNETTNVNMLFYEKKHKSILDEDVSHENSSGEMSWDGPEDPSTPPKHSSQTTDAEPERVETDDPASSQFLQMQVGEGKC